MEEEGDRYQVNGVAGGESGDVGARDDLPAGLGDESLEVIDGFKGRRPESQVGRRVLLARSTSRPVEQYRSIAALHRTTSIVRTRSKKLLVRYGYMKLGT